MNLNKFKYVLLFMICMLCVGLELQLLDNQAAKKVSIAQGIDEFEFYMDKYDRIHEELKVFPVMKDENSGDFPITYENSWGKQRTYGGERTHEGCDLMADSNERGKYVILSMTDGTVKNIGWLEQGGWRIGIESDSGIYYYYAHLDSYEKAFEKGERVSAGQVLGRMGDSGYGKEPGTKGKFAVHLHVGIYIRDINGKERALNPYWYLKRLEI